MAVGRVLDLVCGEGHAFLDEFLRVEDIPPCPICGTARTITWANLRRFASDLAPGVFKAITLEGVRYDTAEDWNRHLSDVAGNLKCRVEDLVLEDNSPASRKARAEEHFHRAHVRRTKLGISEAEMRERRADAQRQKDAARGTFDRRYF